MQWYFCLKPIFLLRYYTHIMQFTHLKYKIQHFLAPSQSYTIVVTINILIFSWSQKENRYHEWSLPATAQPTRAGPFLIYFLALWITHSVHFVYMESYVNFCALLLSCGTIVLRFIHGIACPSFLGMAEYYPFVWLNHILIIRSSLSGISVVSILAYY